MAQDYTTIRVTEAAKADAEQSKRDDETWNDYILRCTENPPPVREFVAFEDVAADLDVGTGDTSNAALAELRDALATIEERTGRIEKTLEDMGTRR
jgi:hypothetical protein